MKNFSKALKIPLNFTPILSIIYTYENNYLLVIKFKLIKNFYSTKFLIAFMTILMMIGSLQVIPITSTSNQTTNFTVNSSDFNWVDLTNDSIPNAFNYAYNVSSTNTTTLTISIEIYNNNSQFLYLYDTINRTISLDNNTARDTINYNFSLSGQYSAKIYWFSPSNEIIYYQQVTSKIVTGLQDSAYNLSYKMYYLYEITNTESNGSIFNFTVDLYFTGSYNVTFNYTLNVFNSQESYVNHDTKQLIGANNTFQEFNWQIPLQPGSYTVDFTWQDFLTYPLAPINRTKSFDITVIGPRIYPGYPNQHLDFKNHDMRFNAFPAIISILFTFGILALVLFLVYKKSNKSIGQNSTTYIRQSTNLASKTGTKPLVPSFCSNCGAKTLGKGDYCPDCGSKLD